MTLHDHSVWKAILVGQDPGSDRSITHRCTKEYTATRVDRLIRGFTGGAEGNRDRKSFGFDYTLTIGVISALGRTLPTLNGRYIFDSIQTDAAINPQFRWTAAGFLWTVIGVNTAIVSPSGYNAGIGFAIPVDTVNRIVPQLISRGTVPRPFLGISLVRNM